MDVFFCAGTWCFLQGVHCKLLSDWVMECDNVLNSRAGNETWRCILGCLKFEACQSNHRRPKFMPQLHFSSSISFSPATVKCRKPLIPFVFVFVEWKRLEDCFCKVWCQHCEQELRGTSGWWHDIYGGLMYMHGCTWWLRENLQVPMLATYRKQSCHTATSSYHLDCIGIRSHVYFDYYKL